MEKRKIYLSGKITGDEGFAEKFKQKEEELSARGDYVFNPALHPDMFTHGQFMQIDLLALSFCDSIYLMDNWRDSKGAKMEFEQAKVLGLDVEFEKEPYILRGAVGYYSDKSDEFDIFNAADISADDLFETKEEAEQTQRRLLHKEAGNVEVLPASEVFGKNIQTQISIKQQENLLNNIVSKTEVQDIISKTKQDNSYMKAPNGNKTSLSEPEWVYLHSIPGKKALENWEYLAAFKYATEGEPVKKLTGNEFQKVDGESIIDRVLTYYTDIFNNNASRIEVGNVILDRKGIRDSLAHGMGKEKAAAFAAVPEIIENGIIFDRQKNWKNRNYDTCVLIAPIELAGKRYAEEVVLRRDSLSNKFYLHEVEIKEKLQELFKTPTKGCSPRSYLIIAQHIEKIKNCHINISKSFEPSEMDVLSAMKKNLLEINKEKEMSSVSLDLGNLFNTIKKESALEQCKQITAKEVLSYIENLKIRHPSKWLQAVKQDAEGLLNLFIEKHGDAAFSEKDLLRGSRDWSQYCYAGGALVSNYNIAKRYCSDDELKKLGWKENGYCPEYPNKKETWQDVQARAYSQASELIKKSVHDLENKRENKIEQKSPTKEKSKDDDFGRGM